MQARCVVGDVVCGGGEVVKPPGTHVGKVAGGVPLAVVPGPRGEGRVLKGHEVRVLAVDVPCLIKEKRRVKQVG